MAVDNDLGMEACQELCDGSINATRESWVPWLVQKFQTTPQVTEGCVKVILNKFDPDKDNARDDDNLEGRLLPGDIVGQKTNSFRVLFQC